MINCVKSIEGNKLSDTYSVEGHTSTVTYSTDGLKINDKLTLGVDTAISKLNNTARSIYTQSIYRTIVNTTTETSFLSIPLIILGGSLNKGDIIRILIYGVYRDVGTPSNTINIKLGDTTLISSTGTLPTIVDSLYKIEFTIAILGAVSRTCPLIGEGLTTIKDVGIGAAYTRPLLMITPILVDVIRDNSLDITYTWGTASVDNSITSYVTLIEKL